MKLPKDKHEGINYWESMADGVLALLLCILLIAMLLILYLVRIPDDDYTDYYEYSTTGEDDYDSYYDEYTDNGNGLIGDGDDGGDGGGGGTDDGTYDEEPVDGGYEDYGETISKAAVYVQVVDGETGRAIQVAGIGFELFGADGALQVLKTYYPEVEEYRQYTTDTAGTFYLPEKIPFGAYSLKNISTIEGYDTSGDVSFTIDYPTSSVIAGNAYYYDWSDPYVITVKLFPGKNTLTFTYTDKSTGEPIADALFEIIAAEDILTKDGTVRYESGTVVDTITTDEDGAGESIELYYGNYRIHQISTPDYYASQVEDLTAEVVNSDEDEETQSILAEKTTVTLSLVDRLYTDSPLSGAEFNLTDADGEILNTATTDQHGKISFTDLDKNATYRLSQVSIPEGYRSDSEDTSFTVDENGLINESATASFQVDNYIIRTAFGVKDKLLRSQVSDINIILYNSEDEVIATWNTSAVEQSIEGIEPGIYRVVLDGDEEKAQTITVKDDFEIQTYEFSYWTIMDVGVFIGGSILLVLVIAGTYILIVRRKRAKGTAEKQNNASDSGL